MRLAFFSPMPPSKTGIADYSAALLHPLGRRLEVEVFTDRPARFDPSDYDALLYQVGNNAYHSFAYEMALEHPGVVVMHESNLHHLLAETTIRRGDWDGYLRELEYNGGEAALAHGQKVRRLEVGPDYEGVPMTRRILERGRAVIVHSRYMCNEMRRQGFAGPIECIPHGAWIPQADRMAYRDRLGLDETTPLAGVFGFLKPYKRIAESLRAFRRLVRLEPRAKLILVGETHPDFPVQSLISTLGLSANVRVLGFVPIEDFAGFASACDIVLNLRYPTVGESSGSLLRALGLGKAVIVSDVGSFSELPDDVCLKVPVDRTEEDQIFEYLNLLVSRPDLARALGGRAKDWVERNCSWESVAERYASFLRRVAGFEEEGEPEPQPAASQPAAAPTPPQELESYVLSWSAAPASKQYAETHLTRLVKTLEITPPGGPDDRILEMGAYFQITPALKTKLGYGEVRACYYGPLGKVERREETSIDGERFACQVELFDAEKDVFPYPDGYFSTVLCCELIEHLFADPMHTLSEINRVLAPGGHVVLTTPNIASLRALSAILQGYHPGFFPQYLRPGAGGDTDARHNREYTAREIHHLLTNAGFEVALLETGEFRDQPHPEFAWVRHLLERYSLPADLRGDGIYAVGRKQGPVRERYPRWLYE